MIGVVIEGGIVTAIVTDDGAMLGVEVVVIDYDTEGADPADTRPVIQDSGKTAPAFVRRDVIEQTAINLRRISE